MTDLCEIRVPTYRRPHLLERCLGSLTAQSHAHWRALVQDDSPDEEGRGVVEKLADPRILYRPNKTQLGCCGNIDLAFTPESVAGGNFACVVEDDNWLLPTSLEENLLALKAAGCSILLRNQVIAQELGAGKFNLTGETSLGGIYGSKDRRLSPLQIRSSMFFCTGLSNGGIFWRLGIPCSFVVGPTVQLSPLQEFCRSLQATIPVWYASEPLAVFSFADQQTSTREPLENRQFNRGRQSILSRLLSLYGNQLVDSALQLAGDPSYGRTVLALCADSSLVPPLSTGAAIITCYTAWAKGWIKRLFIADPLADYWEENNLNR